MLIALVNIIHNKYVHKNKYQMKNGENTKHSEARKMWKFFGKINKDKSFLEK